MRKTKKKLQEKINIRLQSALAMRRLFTAAGITAVVCLAVHLLFFPVLVSGESMFPTFEDGDIVVCTDQTGEENLSVGEVVVFADSGLFTLGKQLVKRVVAMPGDYIWVYDGLLYVNGQLSEYQFESIENPGYIGRVIRIPRGQIFCMGDNRNHSYDCRDIGPVPISKIRYKVLKKVINPKKLFN